MYESLCSLICLRYRLFVPASNIECDFGELEKKGAQMKFNPSAYCKQGNDGA